MEQPLRLVTSTAATARYAMPRIGRHTAGILPAAASLDLALPGSSIRIAGFRQRDYRGLNVKLVDYRPDGPVDLDMGHRSLRLLVVMEEVGDHAQLRSDPRFAPPHPRGALQNMMLLQPGQRAYLCSERLQFLRVLILSFPEQSQSLAGTDSARIRPSFFDASLQRLAELFVADLLHDDAAGIGDSLVAPLSGRLAMLADSADALLHRGGLAAWQLRSVSELMRRQLSGPIPLQTLAGSIGLSRSHFCRAFRASVGMPPHQWHLQIRVAKAKEMLLSRRLPLAEIALTVGFADQAHFTRTFRRTVGMTPGTWQRSNAV